MYFPKVNLPEETLNDPIKLGQFLRCHDIQSEAVDILEQECVDGTAFLSLTENDLKELQIKIGPRKRILSLINSANQVDCVIISNTSEKGGEILQHVPNNINITPAGNIEAEASTSDCKLPNNASTKQKHNIQEHNNEGSRLNIREWIKAYDAKQTRKPSLLYALDTGVVDNTARHEMIRIVCAEIVKFNNDMYPSSDLKTELAKEIIIAFPKLRSLQSSEGHEHFFDKKTNSGFIQYRLKTMRVNLSPSKKKRSSSSNRMENYMKKQKKETGDIHLDEEMLDLKISQLILKMPNENNKQDILMLMDETRPNRQQKLQNSVWTLADILKEYPRFKDYHGELIHREFISLFPGKNKLLKKFPEFYVPRILQFCSTYKPYLLEKVKDLDNVNLKALVLLPELLPSPNYKKKKSSEKENPKCTKNNPKPAVSNFASKVIPNTNLLRFVHTSEDLLSYNTDKEVHKKFKNVQPFLLCNMIDQRKKGQFFIQTDGHLISVSDDPMVAFDILVKLHYCFDVHFASDLTNFYDFITGCIMNLNEPRACCTALHTTLINIELTTQPIDSDEDSVNADDKNDAGKEKGSSSD